LHSFHKNLGLTVFVRYIFTAIFRQGQIPANPTKPTTATHDSYSKPRNSLV